MIFNFDKFKDTQAEDNLLVKIGKWIIAVILYVLYLGIIYNIAFNTNLFDNIYYSLNTEHKRHIFSMIYYCLVYVGFYGIGSFIFLRLFTKIRKKN